MPITFPTSKLTILVELEIDSVWTDVSPYVQWTNRIVIQRGRRPGQRRGQTNRCTLTFKNLDKRFSARYVSGPYYGFLKAGTPLRVSVDPGTGSVRRFTGEVPSWSSQVRGHPNDRFVTVTAVGLLDVIERDGASLLSAPRRYIPTTGPTNPLHYWPMESGELEEIPGAPDVGSTALLPFVGTHTSGAIISTPQWGRGTIAPWLPSGLSRSGAAGLTVVHARVFMPASPTEWTIDHMYAAGTDVGADTVDAIGMAIDVNPLYLGGAAGWPQLQFLPSLAQVAVTVNGEAEDFSAVIPQAFDGNAHHVRWTVRQLGAEVAWTVWIDGESVQSGTTAGAMTLPAVVQIGMVAAASASGLAQGHLAVWTGTAPTLATAVNVAFGRRGEESAFRFNRLAESEEGFSVTVREGDNDVERIGPQRAARLADLLRECEDVCEGLIDETVDNELRLTSRTFRYTQAVALAVDYDAGYILPPVAVSDEVDTLYNDWTITRQDGATARHQVQEGPTSVSAYPDGIGSRPQGGTMPLYNDGQAAAHASFRAYRDSIDAPRFDNVRIDLAKASSLITAWLACDVGSRVQITNPPDDAGPDTIDTTIEGITESFDQADWDVALYLEPSDITQRVDEYTDNDARYDCPGSTLNAPLDTTETAVKVAVNCVQPSVCKWAHDDGNYIVRTNGETMTVTAISSPAITIRGTGTAAHADNASVVPGLPAGIAKGDLLLIWAAIRNTAGVVVAPSGYTRLAPSTADHVALFGKIHSGSESDPTVTFTGGSAGDTTSAQMSAFRSAQLSTVNTTSQTNGSAQDIALPAFTVPRANCVVIYCTWKQDDWTSVAGPVNELGEPSSTTGNDQGLWWAYTVQTAAADRVANTAVVTGGASAVSRAIVVAIPGDVQTLTVTRSTNSVVKTHAAGRQLGLATYNRWAL